MTGKVDIYLSFTSSTGVGVVPHGESTETFDITDIKKADLSQNPGSFYNDSEVCQMRIQVFCNQYNLVNNCANSLKVLDIGLYLKNEKKLLEDLVRFQPDFLMLGWCYSRDSDVTMMLRRHGFFSKMIINHDLRIITKKPTAELDEIQWELLKNIGN